jgi:uncharacterized membrane protein
MKWLLERLKEDATKGHPNATEIIIGIILTQYDSRNFSFPTRLPAPASLSSAPESKKTGQMTGLFKVE